jgi:hypothetical protein
VIGVILINITQCSSEKQVAKEPSELGSVLITNKNNVSFDDYFIGVRVYSYKDAREGFQAYDDPEVIPISDVYYSNVIKIDSLPFGIYDIYICLNKDYHSIPPDTIGYGYMFDKETGDTIDSSLILKYPISDYGISTYQPTVVFKVRVAQDSTSLIEVFLSDQNVDLYNLWPGELRYTPDYWKENFRVE